MRGPIRPRGGVGGGLCSSALYIGPLARSIGGNPRAPEGERKRSGFQKRSPEAEERRRLVLFLAVKKVVDKLGVQAERAPREGVVLRWRCLYY